MNSGSNESCTACWRPSFGPQCLKTSSAGGILSCWDEEKGICAPGFLVAYREIKGRSAGGHGRVLWEGELKK